MFDTDLHPMLGTPSDNDTDDWTTERDVWTVTQIAKAMSHGGRRVGVSTVRGWCEDGLLRATKTSERGHYRVKASDLRLFLNGHPDPLSVAA